jgi:hypothetical protein
VTVTWRPVAAVTSSGPLRAELRIVEQHAGWDFEYTPSISYARRHAAHRPMIIIGADLVAHVHTPITCGGIVLVAAPDDLTDLRTFTHAERAGAAYIAFLPTARPWLTDLLLQSHRWCGMAAPNPPGHDCRPTGGER